jgi:hypothetical protein
MTDMCSLDTLKDSQVAIQSSISIGGQPIKTALNQYKKITTLPNVMFP